MNIIYWAGDSTVQFNDYSTFPQTGLGQGLTRYLKHGIRIENYAKNGRSTKSFLDEGRFEPIEKRISEGDFLFIQFGHNDEKKEDPSRYTDPFGSYSLNLEYMCKKALEVKAHPVLITPLERRKFEGGVLTKGQHTEYVRAMKELSEKLSVPCIDLNEKSRRALEKTGDEDSKKWYLHFPAGVYKNCPGGKADDTHLSFDGAYFYAGLIAGGLKELGGIYGALLTEGDGNIEHI